MNTIHFNQRYELRDDYYVIPFSCSDLVGIDTDVLHRDRTETAQKVINSVVDRITLALQKRGYTLENVNFRNMHISVSKR